MILANPSPPGPPTRLLCSGDVYRQIADNPAMKFALWGRGIEEIRQDPRFPPGAVVVTDKDGRPTREHLRGPCVLAETVRYLEGVLRAELEPAETWDPALMDAQREAWAPTVGAIMAAIDRLRLENDPVVSVRVNPVDLPGAREGLMINAAQVDLTTDQTPGEVLAIGRRLAHAEPIR